MAQSVSMILRFQLLTNYGRCKLKKESIISVLAIDIDGVLTDGRVLIGSSGEEHKFVSYRDIDAVFAARRYGLKVGLVSAESTPWVMYIAKRLEVDHIISGAKDKLAGIHELARALETPLENICYVGDSDRDAPALKVVGLGIAPSNATSNAKASADIIFQLPGGQGAIYETVELIKQHSIGQQSD